MRFFGTLSGSRYIEKYERELASILCLEIMVRISNGTALNVVGGIVSPFFLMKGVVAFSRPGTMELSVGAILPDFTASNLIAQLNTNALCTRPYALQVNLGKTLRHADCFPRLDESMQKLPSFATM
jgi:hypothetical protein